jgi:Ni,Fe-hydrogenase I small subunit
MAITRRQFVTRLGALAAAVGMSQTDLSKLTEAFAHSSPWNSTGGWAEKPKVIWVHGAECTGCSTSLLSLFEDCTAGAIEGSTTPSTLAALGLIVGGTDKVLTASTGHPYGHRTIHNSKSDTGVDFDADKNTNAATIVTIQDVLIDFLDLQYHETIMGMGGDLAYQWLKDNMAGSTAPFVLVVEGATQGITNQGYWKSTGDAPWCSIAQDGATGEEASFDHVVEKLATQATCAAVVSIGQCASYGGYPACQSPVLKAEVAKGTALTASMTGAQGTKDFLAGLVGYVSGSSGPLKSDAANKVINVPGCPANPWWFVLTVVAWLVDFINAPANNDGPLKILHRGSGGAMDVTINASAVDSSGRLKAVYGTPIHGPACPRYQDYTYGKFALKPGDPGCLQLIGCKGPATNSLCALHGWNSIQPHNAAAWENHSSDFYGKRGTFCISAGHPCMGCTEKGYPDSVVPFVVR